MINFTIMLNIVVQQSHDANLIKNFLNIHYHIVAFDIQLFTFFPIKYL